VCCAPKKRSFFVVIIGWSEEGLEYFNDMMMDLLAEKKSGDTTSGATEYETFEKNCVENWSREEELKDLEKKGKKRAGPELSVKARKCYLLSELCSEFGLTPV
jgi:hypothetical protein